MATSQYSDELLTCFEAVNNKTTGGVQLARDISAFYAARAKIEATYAASLTALYKALPGAGMFTKEPPITKETSGSKEAMMSILNDGLVVAEEHQKFSQKITQDVCRNLDAWVKAKEPERKKLSNEGLKLQKSLNDARLASNKAKDNYDKLSKAADAAQDADEKAQSDVSKDSSNKKLANLASRTKTALKTAKDKANAADKTYQDSVTKANTILENFKEKGMPELMKSFQEWDEDRWNVMIESVKTFKNLQSELPSVIENYVSNIDSKIDSADIEQDVSEFINTAKESSKGSGEPLEYKKYPSKYADKEEEKKEEPKKEEEPKEEKKEEKKEEAKKPKEDLFPDNKEEEADMFT